MKVSKTVSKLKANIVPTYSMRSLGYSYMVEASFYGGSRVESSIPFANIASSKRPFRNRSARKNINFKSEEWRY